MKGNKIVAIIVAVAMVGSTIAILEESDVKATRNITTNAMGYNAVVLSNDGSGAQHDKLTCGEIITLDVNDNSLDPSEDYAVKVWTDSGWVACHDIGATDNADIYGDLSIEFHVPGYDELGECPTTGNADATLGAGQWNISLWTESTGGTQVWPTLNITITIGNLYDVYFTRSGGTEIDHLTYGEEETFDINVRNWTGDDGWENDASASDGVGTWDLDILTPTWASIAGFPKQDITADYQEAYVEAYIESYEYYYWVVVSNDANANLLSNVTLPVKLNVTANLPSNAEWGDEFTISGYVYDANQSGISGYDVAIFAPVSLGGKNGGWREVATDGTLGNGKYSITPSTGPDTGWSAGTWYLGTYESGTIDEADMPPYIANFIPYHSFVVGTNEDATVRIENSDDIVSGFEQTINVSVENESWMYSGDGTDSVMEFDNMKIHVTGLDGWDPINLVEYDSNDIIEVPIYQHYIEGDEDYSYYLFNWTFNETGTAKIIASWPGNQTSHTRTTPKAGGNDSAYSNTYNESSEMLANITGERTFSVVSPAGMNLIIDDMVEAVSIIKGPGACSSDRWLNSSDTFLLKVYGSAQSDPQNATITVSGAGLDFTIDENDPDDTKECIGYPGDGTYTDGQYLVRISPKTRGTLTITATNGTDEVSRDYSITGLSGSVTTSIGDDLEFTVGSTETITATLGSDYAEVYVTYFDSTWTLTNGNTKSLNHTVGDGVTQGEGKDGVYTFVPDRDDIDALGYIVVAAEAGTGQYMYDVIEIVPIYDFTIKLLEPINVTQMFTVGLEYDVVFQLLDKDENVVEDDSPSVTVKLIDEDHDEDDPIQTWSSDDADISQSGDEWELDDMRCWFDGQIVITGENASDGITHKGNLTVDVDHATITYTPDGATAGIETKDLVVTVKGIDANGDPLPDGTDLYFWCEDSEDIDVGGTAGNTDAVNFKDSDTSIELDENGEGEFELDEVGDNKTSINATFVDYDPANGNRTAGKFQINFPMFDISPDTIYLGQSNTVTIIAKDHNGDYIEGINLTLLGNTITQPDPAMTNAEGKVSFSVTPLSSGIANVTIARNVKFINGRLNWTNAVVTDTYVTIESMGTFTISVSKSPIFQGETLTVTVKDGNTGVASVDVTFGEETEKTGSDGTVSFIVPDPGVESAIYTIRASKVGYYDKERSITVLKKYKISIVLPSKAETEKKFTVTIIAKGQKLAGATVTFEGKTVISDGDGKATFTAPKKKASYTMTAEYENYETATVTIKISKASPGFELLALIVAIGVAFLLVKRRRRQ